MKINLFGQMDIKLNGGEPLPTTRTQKDLWLLALLILWQNVKRDSLANTLWPNSKDPRGSLRKSLFELRNAMESEAKRLQSPTPDTLRLDLTGAKVDVLEFDAAIRRGDRASLEAAVALYDRGRLLEQCLEHWVIPEREKREQKFLKALEALAMDAETRGDSTAAENYHRRVDERRVERDIQPYMPPAGQAVANTVDEQRAKYLINRAAKKAEDLQHEPEANAGYWQQNEYANLRAEHMTWLEAEHTNVLNALKWSLDADIDISSELRQILTLPRLWERHHNDTEPEELLKTALKKQTVNSPLRADLIVKLSELARDNGDYLTAKVYAKDSRKIYEDLKDDEGKAKANELIGFASMYTGDINEAILSYEESRSYYIKKNDKRNEAIIFRRLAYGAWFMAEPKKMTENLDRGMELLKGIDDPANMASMYDAYGVVPLWQGDYEMAIYYFRQSKLLREQIVSSAGQAISDKHLGQVALMRGDFNQAKTNLEESLKLQNKDNVGEKAIVTMYLAEAECYLRDYTAAYSRITDAQELLKSPRARDPRTNAEASFTLGRIYEEEKNFGLAAPQYKKALKTFAAANNELWCAIIRTRLGYVTGIQNDSERNDFRKSLRVLLKLPARSILAEAFEVLASGRAEQQNWEEATQLLGAAAVLRTAIGTRRSPYQDDNYARVRRKVGSALDVEQFETALRQGSTMTLEDAVERALSTVTLTPASERAGDDDREILALVKRRIRGTDF